ncbi:hypothetical protein ACCS95_34640 [Rhizobium ruizarguesonis]
MLKSRRPRAAQPPTFSRATFDLLDSDAEDTVGSYSKGFQTGLWNIEFASAPSF